MYCDSARIKLETCALRMLSVFKHKAETSVLRMLSVFKHKAETSMFCFKR